jgi:murein DD-endopeptidase MepM/ murein hydrolase activator NlpD
MSHSIHLDTNPPRFIKGGICFAPRRDERSTPFRWPLGLLGDLAPRVLASHDGDRPSVDLGYARAVTELVPVVAANDGEVSLALEGGGGYAVSLDHERTWSTHYTGLAKLSVIRCLPRRKRRQFVRGGDVIGYTTGKLGFELWQWTDDRGFVAVDARPHLASWAIASVSTRATTKEAA